MPKITKELEEYRDQLINKMFTSQELSAENIGIIFGLSTQTVYNIVKDHKKSIIKS